MKKLIVLLYLGVLAYAKPSHPLHIGVGAIYKGPNSETIIEGPDGSIITAEAEGGAVAVNGENAVLETQSHVAASSAAVSHQVIQHSSAAAAAAAATVSQTTLSKAPIVVQEPVLVGAPILVAENLDTASLDGPSGSILRHGENAIISGPASTTIREGKVVASIPHAEVNVVAVEPARTLIAPHPTIVDASVGLSHGIVVGSGLANVAEANAHLSDINLVNEANIAAQISEANRAALAEVELSNINAANAAAVAHGWNSQAALAEANRASLVGAKSHISKAVTPQISVADVNAINSAAWAQSQEALAQANLEAQLSHGGTPVNAVNLVDLSHSQEGLARANYDAQLAHRANAANHASLAHTQEDLARANLEAELAYRANVANSARLVHSQEAIDQANWEAELAYRANAANAAALAHSKEAVAGAGLGAHLSHTTNPHVVADADAINIANLAQAERNALAAQALSHNQGAVLNSVHGLNPVISQGNQIISNGVVLSTPAPVVEVTPISSVAPIISTTARPIVVPARAQTIVSSTIAPTPNYLVSHPRAVLSPLATVDGGQLVYQSSSSSSSEAVAHSSSSSQSSSTNIVNSGVGVVPGIAGHSYVGAPVALSASDLAQWQESFANSRQVAGKSVLAAQVQRGVYH